MEQSIHEKRNEIIRKNEWEHLCHVILPPPSMVDIYTFIDYELGAGFVDTKGVSQDVQQLVAPYTILTDSERLNTFSMEYQSQEAPKIWPRNSIVEAKTRHDFEQITINIDQSKDTLLHIWKIYTAARRNEGDIEYSSASFTRDSRHAVEQFFKHISVLNSAVHASNKTLRVVDGEDIELRGTHTWNDLVLTPEILRDVRDDLEYWIASEHLYRKKSIPYRRGYLFEGPPGNGKTAVVRTIMSTYDFCAYSFNFSNPSTNDSRLYRALELAAESAPSLFLLEDLDRVFAGAERRTHITREGLFNCLDGVATNDGVVVIATANNPELLDSAIRQRPGRFDVPVHFAPPKYPQRHAYFERMLGAPSEHEVNEATLRKVAEGCKGMSMAFLKLVYESALANAHRRSKVFYITDRDFYDGFTHAHRYYKRMETAEDRSVGFTPAQGDYNTTIYETDAPTTSDAPNAVPYVHRREGQGRPY
jgi:AAA+ superfamily predicted ATPase